MEHKLSQENHKKKIYMCSLLWETLTLLTLSRVSFLSFQIEISYNGIFRKLSQDSIVDFRRKIVLP